MKALSQRAEIIVVGGGLAGLCAAITAARQGATVKLVESKSFLGGRVGEDARVAMDHSGGSNSFYQRESGILDELCAHLLSENREGNYAGQNRALMNWVSRQERLEVFMGAQVFEVSLGQKETRIESVLAISERLGSRILFKAPLFIDCTGTGILARQAKASGECGTDLTEYSLDGSPSPVGDRFATCMSIGQHSEKVPFRCPSWVRLRWEDNHLSAKLDLLESLDRNLLGDHTVEWISVAKGQENPTSAEIVWAAWDFLKNRSPMAGRAGRLVVEDFSSLPLRQDSFRTEGDFVLKPADMENGRTYPDSVAVGRSPLDLEDALLCSMRGKVALPHPFEIPLRSLYSKKVKNLFVAGGHASCTSRASASLRHPPTSAQLGEAVGLAAFLCGQRKRLPRTMAKSGYVDELRRLLNRKNHRCSISPSEDQDDLLQDSEVTASSTLSVFSPKQESMPFPMNADRGMIQFPLEGPRLNRISVFLEARENCLLQCGLYESSSNFSLSPGACLDRVEVELVKGNACWVEIPFSCKIKHPGWHFLEFSSNGNFSIFGQKESPVGILLHRPKQFFRTGIANPYSEYSPEIGCLPIPSSAPLIEVSPPQSVYGPQNLVNAKTRPGRLPNLWISEPSTFDYPEFLEFHWDKPRSISCLDIVFDGSSEILMPARPRVPAHGEVRSIVSHYKVYFMNEVGHWQELFEVSDNKLGFRTHEFATLSTKALEIEIISTHGLNRAQIYQVRAYP